MNDIVDVDPQILRQQVMIQSVENIIQHHQNQRLLQIQPIKNLSGTRPKAKEQVMSPVSSTANDKTYINTRTKR